jgi:hypothetical protein
MTTMIAELYDALMAAGAPEEKARAAAKTMTEREDRFKSLENEQSRLATREDLHKLDAKVDREVLAIKGHLTLLQWMLGFNLAITTTVLWVLLRAGVGHG